MKRSPCCIITVVVICCAFIAFVVHLNRTGSRLKYFPADFIWGAGSSSYQIEGAWNSDGKGESIWDNGTHAHSEKFADRTNGDVAANSYEFYKEDVRALKKVGAKFYRFSISWPRIMPDGSHTKINKLGLEYYNKLINELLRNGIQPIVTMYHWDMPQKLQDLGGMTNRMIIEYFVEYAKVLFENFGDRVKIWNTFNEPTIMCDFGYGKGIHAPFLSSPGVGNYLCGHHVLLANAKIYWLYHDYYNSDKLGKIGIVLQTFNYWPKNSSNPEDVVASNKILQFALGWFAHPIFSETGGYPKIMEDIIRINSENEGLLVSRLPVINDDEKLLIRGTSDYFCLNYYTSAYAEPDKDGRTSPLLPTPLFNKDVQVFTTQDPSWPVASSSWIRSVPEGLRDLLNWIKNEYNNPPLLITENGWSDYGEIEDIGREKYFKEHLQAVLDAIWEDGCNVLGYIAWTLIDNFEWTSGYTEKFGLFHVDFNTSTKIRKPKNSVKFLRNVIETGNIFENS